jgi:methylmalonyl-CoA/ethylmalonyl-CoA epimerase
MKAVLDHIGIAVRDVDAALAFYRDALGLDVETPEDVATQRVRARHIRVGGAKLELLEATASDSAIAKYVEKRGPGLHHITLRVEDIRAALEQLKVRGVRLVDSVPRPGAEGALVAFIHPSAAHGVLVELKQVLRQDLVLDVKRLPFGDLQLTMLHDGGFRLDGGAMFSVVPRLLWEKLAPADDRHRIQLAMRPLLVEAAWGRNASNTSITRSRRLGSHRHRSTSRSRRICTSTISAARPCGRTMHWSRGSRRRNT